MNDILNRISQVLILIAMLAVAAALPGCGGGSSSSSTTANPSLSGTVVDGKVSGATLTLYSDLAMNTQVGSGSTNSTGAFSITLTVATAPDPIYIKSVGGTDLDTGLPALTMFFVGNTTGTNGLTSFNVTPLTKDVFDRVRNGDSLSAAQGNARTAFGLSGNTGANGMYEDPSLSTNTTLKSAAFKKLTAGTGGGTIAAGNYKMFAITADESDVSTTAIANTAGLVSSANFLSSDVTVASNGDISGSSGSNFFSGKVVGASMVFDIVDSTTAPTRITRVVGNVGLNGSVAGNFTKVRALTSSPVMTKGVFVGTLIPASGVSASGLATFVSSFYSPGTTTGNMNIVARDIFTTGVPQAYWGQAAVTAVNASAGSITMSNLTMRMDAGSVAAAALPAFTFNAGTYVLSGSIPTNLLVFEYIIPGGTDKLYIVTAVGLRRGIYFVVPSATGKISVVGESYMSKVDSVAPTGFTSGAAHDLAIANIHAGMPGQTRTAVLSQGITPIVAGPLTLPVVTTNNGFIDTTTTGVPELMVFQGSMVVFKKDAANTFATNTLTTPAGADTHIRVLEFFESGAMQGEEIMGGFVPGSSTLRMRDYPSTFIGFVRNRASSATPSFSGTLNFLSRVIYSNSYTGFANAYSVGTLTITAPTTAAGSATLVITPRGGTISTSTLAVDVPASGAPGLYHMSGALTGGGYIDITWPIGGTKALYMVSSAAAGNVTEVGEAYITQ